MASTPLIINVLPPEYSEDCRIKGSVAVPFDDLEAFVAKMPKETKMIVYCAKYSCTLSGKALQRLKKLGFEQVRAYEGGMQEWKQKGFPTEGLCRMSYLTEASEQDSAGMKKSDAHITAEELMGLLQV